MRLLPEETGAIVIDMQEKLMVAMCNSKSCEERASMLIRGLKILDIPIIITQQYTKGLGSSLSSIYEAAGMTEYYEKTGFSCCRDVAIMDAIEKMGRKNILIMGTEAHICALQTAIDLKAVGFQPVYVVDSLASRKELDMKIGIQRAIQEGVIVTTSESVLFELTMTSKHPRFREISALVK